MGNAQSRARYKIKKIRDGKNLLNTANLVINYQHFSIYFNDSMPAKLKPHIDAEAFAVICGHIREAGAESRKDLKRRGAQQCSCIGILLVLVIILVLVGIMCIDYWSDGTWPGALCIAVALVLLVCIVWLFRGNKPNEALWWSHFLVALELKVGDINKLLFANKLHIDVLEEPLDSGAFACRLQFVMSGSNDEDEEEPNTVGVQQLKNLPTRIDYDDLAIPDQDTKEDVDAVIATE